MNPQQPLLPTDQQALQTAATAERNAASFDAKKSGLTKDAKDTVAISDEAAAKFIQENPNIAQMVQDGTLTLGKNSKGENILFADDSLAYHPAREGTENALSGASSSGTQVQVHRQPGEPAATEGQTDAASAPAPSYSTTLTRADGSQLSLSFSNSVFIHEAEDGNTLVYYSDTNKTLTYGADGSVREAEGNLLDADADAIIVNTTAGKIHTGNGNNLVFNWDDDTEITTGNGNDTIILADDIANNTIATGGGADRVEGNFISHSNIDLGQGDNTLAINRVQESTLRAGDGNNQLLDQTGGLGFEIANSTLSLGNGNNTVRIQDADATNIALGNGANDLKITAYLHGGSSVNVGDGNNTLTFMDIDGGSAITVGDGNNSMTVLSSVARYNNGSITVGNGNNALNLFLRGDLSVTVGNGNNNIRGSFAGNVHAVFGNGNNSSSGMDVKAGASVTFGDGNNNIAVGLLSGQMKFGAGNNVLSLQQMLGDALLQVGDGKNNIFIGEMEDNASLVMGNGNNFFMVGSMADQAGITAGNGNNWGLVGATTGNNALPSGTHTLDGLSDAELRQLRGEYGKMLDERQVAPQSVRGVDTNSQWSRFRVDEQV